MGSYKSKPWAYLAYHSQEKRDAAMELTCSLKGQHLQWILPHEVKDLCVRCASSEHKTQDCDTFEHRGSRPIPKNIQQNYNRFKPIGYVRLLLTPQDLILILSLDHDPKLINLITLLTM